MEVPFADVISRALLCGLAGLFWSSAAVASYPCEFYPAVTADCNHSAPQAALPSYSDAFNLNPASIPTLPTPVGAEWRALSTFASGAGFNQSLALLKGSKGLGFALATNDDEGFYTFNFEQAVLGGVVPTGVSSALAAHTVSETVNLGLSVGPWIDVLEKYFHASVAGQARYNRDSKLVDPEIGLALSGRYLSVGLSQTRKRGLGSTPAETLTTWTAAFALGPIHIEYTELDYDSSLAALGGVYAKIAHQTVPIVTGSIDLNKKIFLKGAYRNYLDVRNSQISQGMAAIQFRPWSKLIAGYSYNEIRGAHTLMAQYFFR